MQQHYRAEDPLKSTQNNVAS